MIWHFAKYWDAIMNNVTVRWRSACGKEATVMQEDILREENETDSIRETSVPPSAVVAYSNSRLMRRLVMTWS